MNTTKWKLIGLAASATAIVLAPIAAAQPGGNGNGNGNGVGNHGNQNPPGRSVSGVAGNGPAAVLGQLSGMKTNNPGLPNAASHVPTTSPTPSP